MVHLEIYESDEILDMDAGMRTITGGRAGREVRKSVWANSGAIYTRVGEPVSFAPRTWPL